MSYHFVSLTYASYGMTIVGRLTDILQNAVDIIATANVIELETVTPKSHFFILATFVFLVKNEISATLH